MADTPEAPEAPFSMKEYWTTRSFKASARLHLLHYLYQNTIGYLIHPQIYEALKSSDTGVSKIKIADLGCGNARWLVDVAESTFPEADLDLYGFDINPVNFPAASYTPENVKLAKWDLFANELPSGVGASFDIVHIRAFTSSIFNNDPDVVLKNAIKLLKPGGWLQWEEPTIDHYMAISPTQDVSKSSCDAILQILTQMAKAQNLIYDWVHTLDVHFQQQHLSDTQLVHLAQKRHDFKAWTENYLLVWENIGPLLPSREIDPKAPLTRELWTKLFLQAVEEVNNGVAVTSKDIVVAIGRK